MEYKKEIAILERTGKDIWQNLYEFPLVESAKELDQQTVLKEVIKKKWLKNTDYELLVVSPLYRQQLTHQFITGQFFQLRLKQKPVLQPGWLWMKKEKARRFAFPRMINQYLQE